MDSIKVIVPSTPPIYVNLIPGYVGQSGYSGQDGTSGNSGYSGISGYSGQNGTNGDSGYSGYSGYSGLNGLSGYSGYSGSGGGGGNDEFIAGDVGNIEFATVGITKLYTVPLGKKFAITKEMLICESAGSVMAHALVSTGSNATMYDNGLSSFRPSPVNANTFTILSMDLIHLDTASVIYDATSAPIDIYISVNVGADTTSQKMRVILFGMFI